MVGFADFGCYWPDDLTCPILMFVSDGKQVSAGWIEHEREFAEQTNARIIFLNCGHYIHYYESERIRREIRAFVNQAMQYLMK